MHAASESLDQAAGLRRMAEPQPVQVVAVTSGKGGVGKTNVSVNLSVALASLGRQVMLLDADLGLANVDVLLGLRADYNLSHVVEGRCSLEEVVIPGPQGMLVIPAGSGIQHMASLGDTETAGLIRAFSELNHAVDTLVIDTAAGISDSVVTFTRAAREILVVVCDEPASVTDAYALIKVLSRDHGIGRFHIVANMVKDVQQGRELHAKLVRVTDRYLDVTLDFLGTVPFDDYLRKSVQKQRAVVESYPRSPSATALRKIAKATERWPQPQGPQGHLEFFVERMIRYSANSGEHYS